MTASRGGPDRSPWRRRQDVAGRNGPSDRPPVWHGAQTTATVLRLARSTCGTATAAAPRCPPPLLRHVRDEGHARHVAVIATRPAATPVVARTYEARWCSVAVTDTPVVVRAYEARVWRCRSRTRGRSHAREAYLAPAAHAQANAATRRWETVQRVRQNMAAGARSTLRAHAQKRKGAAAFHRCAQNEHDRPTVGFSIPYACA